MKSKHNFGIFIIFFVLKFLGLLPFSINLNTFEISFSIKSIIWCVLFSGALLLIDPYIEGVAYMLDNPYEITISLTTVLSKGTYVMIFFCVYWSIFNVQLLFKIINLFKTIFGKLKEIDDNFHELDIWIIKKLLKFLVIQIVALGVYFVYFENILKVGMLGLAPLTSIKHMFGSFVLVKYDICLILLRIGFSKINQIIERSNPENGNIISELSEIHSKLCEASILISKKFSIPILLYLGYIFIAFESKCFTIFKYFAYGTKDGILGSLCKLVWLFSKLSEFAFILMDGNIVIQKVCKVN